MKNGTYDIVKDNINEIIGILCCHYTKKIIKYVENIKKNIFFPLKFSVDLQPLWFTEDQKKNIIFIFKKKKKKKW